MPMNKTRRWRNRLRYVLQKITRAKSLGAFAAYFMVRAFPGVEKVFGNSRLYQVFYLRHIRRAVKRRAFFETICIETTNTCNATCAFCPYPEMTRKKHTMTDDEFAVVLDKVCRLQHKPSVLAFTHFGEPFVDKKIISRIQLARTRLGGNIQLQVTTNGSLISSRDVKEFLTSGIDVINISFNGINKEDYEKAMGLNYDKSFASVRNLFDVKAELGLSRPIINVGCIMHSLNNDLDVDAFRKLWIGYGANSVAIQPVNLNHASAIEHYNTPDAGKIERHDTIGIGQSVQYPCSALWTDCIISSSGDVSMCALDYDNECTVGNALAESLEAIWENRQRQALQALHIQNRVSDVPLCKNCDSPRSVKGWLLY